MIAWPAKSWPESARETRGAGGRLCLAEGPICLILDIVGPAPEVRRAEDAARAAFAGLLSELVGELSLLRSPVALHGQVAQGRTASAMCAAVRPFATDFITPMAAVAGAVADHVLDAVRAATSVRRAAVNNGGDIALFLAPGERFRLGIHDGVPGGVPGGGFVGRLELGAQDGVGGIATSGWRGRSHSLGIADAVTVLARTAAEADAAATMIANAVDLPGSPRVERVPAQRLSPDSDLGSRLVTTAVGPLAPGERQEALARGLAYAEACRGRGLIRAAFLCLQCEARATGGATELMHERGGAR